MIKPYIDLYTRILLIIGGLIITLNYLFNFDFPADNILVKILLAAVVFSTIYNLLNRDFYLPFLGHTVLPLTADKISGNLITIKLTDLPPESSVIYWAASESDKTFEDPITAYGSYKNSGIGKSDKDGKLNIKILNPSSYNVPKMGGKKKIQPHVHYRYELKQYPGMFSKIFTKNV